MAFYGDLIRKAMKEAGYSQLEFAGLMKISRYSLITKLQAHNTPPDLVQASKKYLKIDIPGKGLQTTNNKLRITGKEADLDPMDDLQELLRMSDMDFRMWDNSMAPKYPRGCYIATTRKKDSVIVPGKVYALETESGLYFAKIDFTESGDYLCITTNPETYKDGLLKGKLIYPPYVVPRKEVVAIYDILLGANQEKNSVVRKK